jgi:hypothetical protein
MITVGVRELRNNLSHYLRDVKTREADYYYGTRTVCGDLDAR